MSYCRWSSGDFKSDVYCYYHVGGYYQTHVGTVRYVIDRSKLPDIKSKFGDPDYVKEYVERHKVLSDLLTKADTVKIGLKYDGRDFADETPEECLDTLLMLRDEGYYVPDYAIERLNEEIKEAEVGNE